MTFDEWMRHHFPNLHGGDFEETSIETDEYNCIAYAAGDDGNWWWPHPDGYWPDGVPMVETVDAFIQAFRTRNFELCNNGDVDPQYEKIAIYADNLGNPKHAAKQLPSGKWSSKLGISWDISHDAYQGVEGKIYGIVVQFMRRPRLP
jgi:hypothetical protein